MLVWRNGWYNDSLIRKRSAFVPCEIVWGEGFFIYPILREGVIGL